MSNEIDCLDRGIPATPGREHIKRQGADPASHAAIDYVLAPSALRLAGVGAVTCCAIGPD
jgi:hypothetical protein